MKKSFALFALVVALPCAAQQPPVTSTPTQPNLNKVQPIITPEVLKEGRSNPLAALELAAEKGDAAAQYQMGVAYLSGNLVKKDLQQAAQWFAMSADQGEDRAQVRLGYMLQLGRGVPRDAKRAARLFEASARAGNSEAQARFGLALERGEGVRVDIAKAYTLYFLADQAGEDIASDGLERLSPRLTPEQRAKARSQATHFVRGGVRRY